jgi:hypothetical protein
MCVLVKDMAKSLVIGGTYAGTYTKGLGVSYYLAGEQKDWTIHFTVVQKGNEIFNRFHVTYCIGQKNVQVWYTKRKYTNLVEHLPDAEGKQWDLFWNKAQWALCDDAARQFWDALNVCP